MSKYIDAEKLKELINEKWKELADKNVKVGGGKWDSEISTYLSVLRLINSLQQEQPIRGPHTESWIEETKQELQHEEELLDMRLETLKRIRDKKNQFQQEQPLTTEKVVEQCKKFGGNPEIIQREQPEVELEREIRDYFSKWSYNIYNGAITMDNGIIVTLSSIQNVARYFWNKGYNARKED